MNKVIKERLKTSKVISIILLILTKVPFNNKIKFRGKNNKLVNEGGGVFKSKIEIIGDNNTILIEQMVRMRNCRIVIHGNNNLIHIKKGSYFDEVGMCIDFNKNEIVIGENTIINKGSHFSCMEGTFIRIGNDCLFSAEVTCRTGDSHSIIDKSGKRINHSQNIIIENHVWAGAKATFLKGAYVPADSVVAMLSVVTKSFQKSGVVLAGIPSHIVKENINWDSRIISK